MSRKSLNARIAKADLRFYPEVMASQIELTLQMDRGSALFKIPASEEKMLSIYENFQSDSLNDLQGKYCRAVMDEDTGRVMSIMNIIHDECTEITEDPVV